MRKIAIYGKGGIGKSTITSSLSAAISSLGYKVMQIGCDPKADSSINLLKGKSIVPVMSYLKDRDGYPGLEEIVAKGFKGVLCVEAGGPTPGSGCAGRGIIAAFDILEELHAFEAYKPDFVFYDVLGDVVCGGFAAPIREGYADEVLIVTSGEKMSLFAANNINTAVNNFADRGYARVRGIILNRRNTVDEELHVRNFAACAGLQIIGDVPRDDNIQLFENNNQTVIEGNPGLPISKIFFSMAQNLINEC
ncbi:MAG TPA: nitrogen fixation protein NifH [Pelotomaculum sp.]|nr:nitrogen fixation protein NifH [Pelotomaculum sp.]